MHIRRVFTVRLYRSAAAWRGRGRAKERKERSFGVQREVVEPCQPFGSRGAHNAAIVSRSVLLPSVSPFAVPTLRTALALRDRQRNFDRPLRTPVGRLNFLFRDTCNRYVRLNECSSFIRLPSPRSGSLANSPSSSTLSLSSTTTTVAAPRARLCWRRSPIPSVISQSGTRRDSYSRDVGIRIEFCAKIMREPA